jgi:NADH pyrophosphatase NudC (nudix superfamily)
MPNLSPPKIIAVRRNRLLTGSETLEPLYLDATGVPSESVLVPLDTDDAGHRYTLLEIDGTIPEGESLSALGATSGARFSEVMTQLGRFAGAERARVLQALALAQWSNENRFCSACGASLRWNPSERTKSCTNPEVTHRHFPRTDPATIMLVHDGDRALLGRQKNWPPGMYSTLAGFVEPGESAEDAVVREVLEETGVRAGDVRYFGSESWPFPRSLMLGFIARAETSEVRVGEELEDARWFTRDEVAAMQTRTRERLPYFETIARRLLAEFARVTPEPSRG